MAISCSKTDSIPPACSEHGVALVQRHVPIDFNAPDLGSIPCLICPVSSAVVHERTQDSSE